AQRVFLFLGSFAFILRKDEANRIPEREPVRILRGQGAAVDAKSADIALERLVLMWVTDRQRSGGSGRGRTHQVERAGHGVQKQSWCFACEVVDYMMPLAAIDDASAVPPMAPEFDVKGRSSFRIGLRMRILGPDFKARSAFEHRHFRQCSAAHPKRD